MSVELNVNIIALLILAIVLHSNVKNGGGSKFRQQIFVHFSVILSAKRSKSNNPGYAGEDSEL